MFRLLKCSITIVLLASVLVSADNSIRSLDQSTLQSAKSQPILLRPIAIDGVPVDQTGSPTQAPDAPCTGLWQGAYSGFLPSWFYGDESYAVYQDPTETGCVSTYPFTVNNVHMYLNAQGAATFDVQPMIWAYSGPDVIGAVLCAGPTLTYNLPSAGLYEIAPAFSSPCVVGAAYYAGIYFPTYLGPDVVDIVLDDGTAVPPRSDAVYNDWGGGWVDLVDDQGFPWNLMLWSEGETAPSGCSDPDCVEVVSMTVSPGQTGVEISIKIGNTMDLNALVVPIKIETLSGSASITSARLEYRERITGSVFDLVRICNQREDSDNSCTSYPLVSSACGIDYPVASMPESFLFAGVKIISGLPAGQDVDGSLVLIVDIGPGEGTLIIDTTCLEPANHLEYIDAVPSSIKPSFAAGIITVTVPSVTLPPKTYTIPELHDSVSVFDVAAGDTVVVIGQYTKPSLGIFLASYTSYLKRKLLPANSSMLLAGPDPETRYNNGGTMKVTGVLQVDPAARSIWGIDTLALTLNAIAFEYLRRGYDDTLLTPVPPLQPPDQDSYLDPDTSHCDPCKFAILVSSSGAEPAGDEAEPGFWDDLAKLYAHKINNEGYCEENIFVHYASGGTDDENEIPDARTEPCTEADIQASHDEIANRIAACKLDGKETTVQKMFTNHGADGDGVVMWNPDPTVFDALSPASLTAMQQGLINAGCNTLIDEFLTCYAGDMLDGLEALDNKNNTQIHANASAHGHQIAWGSLVDGSCVYLQAKIDCLAAGGTYEQCVREAERAYLEHLENLLGLLQQDLADFNDEIDLLNDEIAYWQNELALGNISQANFDAIMADIQDDIDYWQGLIDETIQDIANIEQQTGTDDDGSSDGEGCPSWVTHTFHNYCECKEFVGEPGGQLEVDFSGGSGGCGNVTVWEKQEDGTWKRVRIWNWNLPGSAGHQPGNETRRLDIPPTSTGVYMIHNDNGEFTVHVESHNGTQSTPEDQSNLEEFAGFSMGGTDLCSCEFGTYLGAFHSTDSSNFEGFNLYDVPLIIGVAEGIATYQANYEALAYNQWWDDMEVVLNIIDVSQVGQLRIDWNGLTDSSTTIMIDTIGEYRVPLGGIPAPSSNFITFATTASGAAFTWEAWSVRTLVPLDQSDNPTIQIGTVDDVPIGGLVELPVQLNATSPNDWISDRISGHYMSVTYDASALQFMGATPGPDLYDPAPDGCGWEYFTYRFGPDETCAPCPTGVITVIGIADVNDGDNHPSCFLPDSLPATLFTLNFQVAEDPGLECSFQPVSFYWSDCGDNTISSIAGDTVYVSDHVYDFEGTDITDSSSGFPSGGGAPDVCLDTFGEPPMPVRAIDFYNGGINVACGGGCCGLYTGGFTGNVTCDEQGKRNLADITELINHIYISKAPLCCPENGNIDGDELDKKNLADITELINHVYIAKGPTAPCE